MSILLAFNMKAEEVQIFKKPLSQVSDVYEPFPQKNAQTHRLYQSRSHTKSDGGGGGEADQGPLKREGNRGTDQGENNSLNGKFLAFFFFFSSAKSVRSQSLRTAGAKEEKLSASTPHQVPEGSLRAAKESNQLGTYLFL